MNSLTERIGWIDLMRGFCMLLILWFHTEMYYAGSDLLSYHLYVCNALTAFFFLSGYLFYSEKAFSLRRKLRSVLRGIIIPYFFFTSILAVPKALVSHLNMGDVIVDILTGQASWFVAALAVAEVLFSLVLWVNNRWLFHIMPVMALTGALLLNNNEWVMSHNYWYYQSALIALVFIYLGYQYHRFENYFQLFYCPLSLFLVLMVFILLKIYVHEQGLQQLVAPVIISNFPVFLSDTVCFILLSIGLFQRLTIISWLQWVGRHSLVYYFFCGAVPMIISKAFTSLNFQYHAYWQIPIAFVTVCLVSTAIVWLCYYLFPFLKK